jgi:hypothetical protein
MLELKISKSEWEDLTPAVQELYTSDGDGYALQVKLDDREDVGPLKRALERVKADLGSERDARKLAESKLEELDISDARKRGDIDKLTQQWEKTLSDKQTAHDVEVSALRAYITQTAIDNVVGTITLRNTSSKENAELLDPHVRKHLTVEFNDDGPQVMMASEFGPVPLDMDAFEKGVVDNPAYKAIIVANKASGGGAADEDSGNGGGAFPTDSSSGKGASTDLASMDPRQLAQMLSNR